MRIRKHGGLVDVDKDGKVIITPFAGQPLVITGDVEITGDTSITGDVTEVITEAELSLADNTTANSSTTKHGFLKKLSNVATEFMNGVGNWVAIVKGDVGLGNVDNTSDVNKPVSTAQAAADVATQAAAEATAAAALLVESNQRIGNDAQYTKTTSGVQTLLGGNAVARAIIISVIVDETFAAGDGAATLFDIGETGNPTKFVAGLNAGTALDRLIPYSGFLSANTALIITPTPATGTGTGGIHVTALALPEA